MKTLIWFKNDLRVNDHQGVSWALQNSSEILAIYCLNENLAPERKKFVMESVEDLRRQLQGLKIELTVTTLPALGAIPDLVKSQQIQTVLCSKEFNSQDAFLVSQVTKKISPIELKTFETSTLLSSEKLPFQISEMPEVFTSFRKLVEKKWHVEPCLPLVLADQSRHHVTSVQKINQGLVFHGGTCAALNRLDEYFQETKSVSHYKDTRNGLIDMNDSSKFSPWLSLGCLSARQIYWELKKYEDLHGANESTYWLVFELLWRDYFKFLAEKIKQRLFDFNGLKKNQSEKKFYMKNDLPSKTEQQELFQKWMDGQTEDSFINANMIELKCSGWMSNRGRQNVASYLSKTLNVDWTWGSQFFAERLVDYDCESNWGNWLYVAGVGTDPRDRIFNPQRQAQMYDPHSEYQKIWLNLTKNEACNE